MKDKEYRYKVVPFFDGEETDVMAESMDLQLEALNKEFNDNPMEDVSPLRVIESEINNEDGDLELGSDVIIDDSFSVGNSEEEGDDLDAFELDLGGDEDEGGSEDEDEGGSEDDQDNQSASSSFDLEGALKEIEGSSNSKLRKHALDQKAIATDALMKAESAQRELEEAREEFSRREQEFTVSKTSSPEIPFDSTEDYKNLHGQYSSKLSNTTEWLQTSSRKEYLQSNHLELTRRLMAIQSLQGQDFDDARADFNEDLEDKFGEDKGSVLSLIKDIASIDKEIHQKQTEYNENSSERSREYHENRYKDSQSKIRSNLKDYFSVSSEEKERNPFTVVAFADNLMNGQQGSEYRKISEHDDKEIVELLSEDRPFSMSNYKGMSEGEAKRQYIKENEKRKEVRDELVPRYIKEGKIFRRVLPSIMQLISDNASKPKSPSPAKRTSPSPSRKRSTSKEGLGSLLKEDQDELDALNAHFSRGL